MPRKNLAAFSNRARIANRRPGAERVQMRRVHVGDQQRERQRVARASASRPPFTAEKCLRTQFILHNRRAAVHQRAVERNRVVERDGLIQR